MLELGCGDGANALSIAQTLPGASVLGVDASAAAIARGTALAEAAGLVNVRLRRSTFEDLQEQLGEFDYIVAHGVYSWISPAARGSLLSAVKRCLAPDGIAFISYNAYPGSYLRDMARDMLRYHVRDAADPNERLARAHELMQVVVAIEQPSPFARVLREHMERMLRYSDALLFHDDLAEIATPFYFHEFMEHAAHHGLQFLSDADLAESQMRDVPDSAAALMASLPDDVIVREQYLDFFKNRMFRQTLLCHDAAPVNRALDDLRIESLWISSPALPEAQQAVQGETFATPEGFTVTTSEPLVSAALHALAGAWPAGLSFPQLLSQALERAGMQAPGGHAASAEASGGHAASAEASGGHAASAEVSGGQAAARLRAVLLQAHLARIVQLHGCCLPLAARAPERPLASPLARAQHAAGTLALSSLLHTNVRLEGELEPRLLTLLEGRHTAPELAVELDVAVCDVDAALARIASIGLLVG